MESLYYVMCWQCHRRCPHCYEDRFHPYTGEELRQIVAESQAAFPAIIANLPPRMTFLDAADEMREKRGKIILAGGEILHAAVREPILYPALELLHRRYKSEGGIEIIVQTTGDLLTARIVSELLARHVTKISVSGLDAFHEGMESQHARDALQAKLTALFEDHGMQPGDNQGPPLATDPPRAPSFSFFGANPDSWIGALWPRGRAMRNELSTATLATNFCNGWSGGLNFLQHRLNGSEVSIDPEGNVYPCCIKTRKAIGNLKTEPLEAMLDRLAGNPVYEAISMGHPERMGITHGWSVEKFLEKSQVTRPSGRAYRNLCVGCDAFHDEVLDGLVTIGGLRPSP